MLQGAASRNGGRRRLVHIDKQRKLSVLIFGKLIQDIRVFNIACERLRIYVF